MLSLCRISPLNCRCPIAGISFFCRMFAVSISNTHLKNKIMETTNRTVITVEATINAPVQTVWKLWTSPQHITQWCAASDDWCAPRATNDLRTGGHFSTRMEAKDGSMGFDFSGSYDAVEPEHYLEYTIEDGRKVKIRFEADGDSTRVTESFEAENMHPADFQQAGWQAILDNFKKYAEKK